jgi:hypothetical protein
VKPDTRTAMGLLIGQIREAIPFGDREARVCIGACNGCSLKLMDYLDTELQDWEHRLAESERPNLGDLSRLAQTARKIHAVLARNGLVEPAPACVDRHLPRGRIEP